MRSRPLIINVTNLTYWLTSLRQSSDDLTRLGRTYVITADPEYEREYMNVLDIRSGKLPRPTDYQRIYWDFVAAGNSRPRADGQTIALEELMKKNGFTEQEFAKLKQAKANSDGLVNLEVKAMNAVKGKFQDANGQYTVSAEPDFALARNIMHSPEYHKFKAEIMQPIDDFFVLLDQRTAGVVKVARQNLDFAQNGFILTLIALIVEIILLGIVLRKNIYALLGCKPDVLDAVLNELALGNLSIELPVAPVDSALSKVRVVQLTLQEFLDDTLLLTRSSVEGQLSTRIDASRHQGDYQ